MDTVLFKYHGHGEDYLVYDTCINGERLDAKAVRAICARNFGLGALGILAGPVQEGNTAGVRMYRPDGSQADPSASENEIFSSYLKDAGYLGAEAAESFTGGEGGNREESPSGLEEAKAVGKLFLSDEFMKKNHLCTNRYGR